LGGTCIVILSEKEKEEMEEELSRDAPDMRGSRIVCRSGSPTNGSDLKKVCRGNSERKAEN
jgi:hypothetical protein